MKLWEKVTGRNSDMDREFVIQNLCPSECLNDGKKYIKDCQYTTCERCWDQECKEEV